MARSIRDMADILPLCAQGSRSGSLRPGRDTHLGNRDMGGGIIKRVDSSSLGFLTLSLVLPFGALAFGIVPTLFDRMALSPADRAPVLLILFLFLVLALSCVFPFGFFSCSFHLFLFQVHLCWHPFLYCPYLLLFRCPLHRGLAQTVLAGRRKSQWGSTPAWPVSKRLPRHAPADRS